MIIHNGIHEILVDISLEQGWNEESQILHLCGFLHWIRRNGPLHELAESALEAKFRAYLRVAADEENAGIQCVRCDTALTEDGRCGDETCPFSDTDQDDERGWAGHPSRGNIPGVE